MACAVDGDDWLVWLLIEELVRMTVAGVVTDAGVVRMTGRFGY